MKVLRAIGGFFAKIWKWIKTTAWVQPLLIVGIIFAVIFSIPYITSAIQAALQDTGTAFYDSYKISLNGVKKEGGDSEVEKLTKAILDYRENGTKDQEIINRYGEKFFLSFYQDDCSGCETMKGAFEVLRDEWGKQDIYTPLDGSEQFRLHTVDCLETLDDVDEPFETFYNGPLGGDLFNYAAEDASERPYFVNAGSTYETELMNMQDAGTFSTPTTLLIDFGAELWSDVISEVFFVLTPDEGDENNRTRALLLMDAWNHTGKFSEDYHGSSSGSSSKE